MKNFILIFFLILTTACSRQPEKIGVWEIAELMEIPSYRVLKQDSVMSILYEGLEYRGKAKDVFAYYCTPGLLSGDRSEDKNLPAMVLVHGGGGTAFRDWVVLWARQGYAAIAMDTRGFGEGRQPLENGFKEPEAGTPYYAAGDTLSEHWLYQAVGDVVRAHSLVRSFSEVDSLRTALTGISWGGVITCMVSGVDRRFKAFVPVYGCGYLYESSNMKASLDKLPAGQYERWVRDYDPSNYIGRIDRPFLFVNGTNDGHFYLDSYRKTYRQTVDHTLVVKPRMRHGHPAGWNNPEIVAFTDRLFRGGPGLARWGETVRDNGGGVQADVRPGLPVVAAELNYTVDSGELKKREWRSLPVVYRDEGVSCDSLPTGTTVWYFSVTDEAGCYTSGDIIFEAD